MGVAILKYNAGNVRSVSIALNRLGIDHEITDDPDRIESASHVIMPGVGEASTAMRYLRERGLPDVIRGLTQPVLGICLGLQLLCRHTEENNADCIGVFPENVLRFKTARKVPHIGWNRVVGGRRSDATSSQPVGTTPGQAVGGSRSDWTTVSDYFYFVHSYYAEVGPSTVATTEYGEEFGSILQRDNFLATQFHPEKSAGAGYGLLRLFLDVGDDPEPRTSNPQK